MLCDMIDVLVHVFSQDARMYYDLDSLWGDAKRVEWREGGELEGMNSEHPTSNIEPPTSK
jgi:hypothetical protein